MNTYTPSQLQAIAEVLQELLVYEGGEMQSLNETVACSIQNDNILKKAKELGIQLRTDGIGRK